MMTNSLGTSRTPIYSAILLAVTLLVLPCGLARGGGETDSGRPAATDDLEWARVASVQRECALRERRPVAFENDLGMRFVLIPAGTFLMGSAATDKERGQFEDQHQVTLSKSLYLLVHEVTNGQFRRFREDHDSDRSVHRTSDSPEKTYDKDAQPVVEVTHKDASDFARWLSNRDEKVAYRLPTEAEWEYACRAGTKSVYFWGNDLREAAKYANVQDERAHTIYGVQRWLEDVNDGFAATAPVGSFEPNPWGIYDVIGNADEWVADWFDLIKPPRSGSDPKGPPQGRVRVLRGGSCLSLLSHLRCAYRNFALPTLTSNNVGFRLVAERPTESAQPSNE